MLHLPKEASDIAAQEDWDADIIVLHLIGFIGDNVDSPEWRQHLADYFRAMAAEENRLAQDIMGEDD